MTGRFSSRLGCSTISFRHQDLAGALTTIAGLGFTEIDLGALPGVCDHVPYVLDEAAVDDVARTVAASGLRVRSINGDIGDLNAARRGDWSDGGESGPDGNDGRDRHTEMLVELAAATGAEALVLPCGALDHQPIESLSVDLDRVAAELHSAASAAERRGVAVWTESLHYHRLCFNLERAQALTDRLDGRVGIVLDFSHVVASGGDPVEFVDRFGPRIAHVHIRDAVPGNINLSPGNGAVDFGRGLKALADAGYTGHFSLELETRDVTHDERPAATTAAGLLITDLI
ncbi:MULTISPECIES: sugar phosphate isomerase/epimerase family protein [Mycobacteriaceae]|nr:MULTISPECIES: sugar phosphate isomerase/epimerase [Mycobacteriaceae]AHC23717.2 xylose isomerase [Mycolicibacterium neoaurum VKM Ac-1815D]AMO08024.1 xylose isomerase [Mycolicibacterium neoaurum]AXK78645.1 sugar phosphate isomerase/epimerase [Mycolicibacterium neoaurum]KJQ48229.1 xylose isomerase [Mycolicibacterium neoaurum]KUM06570.1 xylose isomerase [Mycolicibacterium neoaurum]